MREEEDGLSFADFGGSERLYPNPTLESDGGEPRDSLESMARREGLAGELRSLSAPPEAAREPPTLRFEIARRATPARAGRVQFGDGIQPERRSAA